MAAIQSGYIDTKQGTSSSRASLIYSTLNMEIQVPLDSTSSNLRKLFWFVFVYRRQRRVRGIDLCHAASFFCRFSLSSFTVYPVYILKDAL